jgi:hypothetical protein
MLLSTNYESHQLGIHCFGIGENIQRKIKEKKKIEEKEPGKKGSEEPGKEEAEDKKEHQDETEED